MGKNRHVLAVQTLKNLMLWLKKGIKSCKVVAPLTIWPCNLPVSTKMKVKILILSRYQPRSSSTKCGSDRLRVKRYPTRHKT